MKNLIIILAIFLSMSVSYQFTYSQWVQRYNGPGNGGDDARSIAVDSSGNVYVTGGSFGDYATLKYNSTGAQQWVQRYDGPGNNDFAHSIAVDNLGNVYVTGQSGNIFSLPGCATIKYSSSGVQQWVQRCNAIGRSIAVDDSGNVYVTGASYSGQYPNFITDYITIKYNSNGDSLWVQRYNGSGNNPDQAFSIALDGTGNVYVTGVSTGIGAKDYATIKYSSSGVQQWVQRYARPGKWW